MLLLLLACGPKVEVEADSIPQSGYVDVTFTLDGIDPASVSALRVAGLSALDLRPGDGTLTALVQGSPTPGDAAIVLSTPEGDLSFDGVFSYEPTPYPELENLWAIGASLTMGFEAAGLGTREGLYSPPAQMARATGAWLGLPLVKQGLMPPLSYEDVGPGCRLPSYTEHLLDVVPGLFTQLMDGSHLNFAQGRLDPELSTTNLGVAGTDVGNLLEVPSDSAEEIFARLAYSPETSLDAFLESQVSRVEAANPTVILVMDVMGNEIIDPLVADDPFDLNESTPPEDLRAELTELFDRLEATGAWVFFGNQPLLSDATFAANTWEDALAYGYSEEEAQARLDALDARCLEYNALIDELAAGRERLVVVDVAAAVREVAEDGVDVDGVHLSTDRLGGLASLDGVHFSSTGYAVFGNLFLEAMDERLGLDGVRIDPAEALAGDPASPAALRAAGLDPDACAR